MMSVEEKQEVLRKEQEKEENEEEYLLLVGFDKLIRDLQKPEDHNGSSLKLKQLFGMLPKIIDLIDLEDEQVKDVMTRIVP
jgi:hypothetical protein